jgi:hypothetical protein
MHWNRPDISSSIPLELPATTRFICAMTPTIILGHKPLLYFQLDIHVMCVRRMSFTNESHSLFSNAISGNIFGQPFSPFRLLFDFIAFMSITYTPLDITTIAFLQTVM